MVFIYFPTNKAPSQPIFTAQKQQKPSVFMERIDFKDIANARISGRIKQMVVLLLTIVIGILISIAVNS